MLATGPYRTIKDYPTGMYIITMYRLYPAASEAEISRLSDFLPVGGLGANYSAHANRPSLHWRVFYAVLKHRSLGQPKNVSTVGDKLTGATRSQFAEKKNSK